RDLLGHRRDHRVGCLGGELAAVGSLETCHVAGNLDHHPLQANAEPQYRDLVCTCVADGADLAFNTANPEPTWDDDTIDLAQHPGRALPRLAVVRGHPADHDSCMI